MSARPNSAGDAKKAIETFGELCNEVEHALGVKIPKYLKNILFHSGFDNRVSLRSFEESDVFSLETLAKSEAYIRKSYPPSDFFSPLYESDCKEFTIIPGHRKLLIAIAAYLRGNPKIVKTSQK